MKKFIFLIVIAFLAAPLLFSAEKASTTNNQEAIVQKTQDLIYTRVLFERDGVQKLKVASDGLNQESKESLYNQNKKSAGLAWLNLVVPSVGSWIIGDKEGAIGELIGDGICIVGSFAGGVMLGLGSVQHTSSSYSGGFTTTVSYPEITQPIGTVGLVVIVVSLVGVLVVDFVSIGGAYHFVDVYNNNLKTGLGLVSYDNRAYDNMKERFVSASMVRSSDLFSMDLFTLKF